MTTSLGSRLDDILRDFVSGSPDIEAAAVVSFDGLPMASALPAGMEDDRVAAMSAALLALGERAAAGLGRGSLSQVFIEGDDGYVFLQSADGEAVLVAVAAPDAKVGLAFYELRRVSAQVAAALREPPAPEPVEPPPPYIPAYAHATAAPEPVPTPNAESAWS